MEARLAQEQWKRSSAPRQTGRGQGAPRQTRGRQVDAPQELRQLNPLVSPKISPRESSNNETSFGATVHDRATAHADAIGGCDQARVASKSSKSDILGPWKRQVCAGVYVKITRRSSKSNILELKIRTLELHYIKIAHFSSSVRICHLELRKRHFGAGHGSGRSLLDFMAK